MADQFEIEVLRAVLSRTKKLNTQLWTQMVAIAAFAVLGISVSPLPALAHSSETPQSVEVSANGTTVNVVWYASTHDLQSLAMALGVVPSTRSFVFENGEMVSAESGPTEMQLLEQNPDVLEAYLLQSIAVEVPSGPCEGSLGNDDNLAKGEGVTLNFECETPVQEATITVATMQEMGPDYVVNLNTSGPSIGQHDAPAPLLVLDGEQPTFTASFDAAGAIERVSQPDPLTPVVWVSVGALVLAASVVVGVWLKRRAAHTRSQLPHAVPED